MKKFSSISRNNSIKSVVIGKFDGVHIAHKKILQKLDKSGIVVLIKMNANAALVPFAEREFYMQNRVFYIDIKRIKGLSGKQFIRFLVRKLPYLQQIIVGYDFTFGKNRSCRAYDINRFCDVKVDIVNVVRFRDIAVHSSNIKQFLQSGDIQCANAMLGRNYSISGKIISGQGIGSQKLVPTINLSIQGYFIPQNGVYATYVRVGGRIYKAISFIGKRFSTDGNFSIESHILDEVFLLQKNKIQRKVRIFFVKKIRDNRAFDKLENLKTQILVDIAEAREILLNNALEL